MTWLFCGGKSHFFCEPVLKSDPFKTVYWDVKKLLTGCLTEDSLRDKMTGDDIFTPSDEWVFKGMEQKISFATFFLNWAFQGIHG